MLRGILAVAMVAAVIVAEKTPAVAHAAMRTEVLVGVAFAAPFLLAIWVLGRLAGTRPAAAPAPRAYGQSGGSPNPSRNRRQP